MTMRKSIFTIFLVLMCMAVFGQAKKPTIMVVPSDVWCVQNDFSSTYDNQGVSETVPDYVRALQNDANLLLAIGKINSMMTDRGFPLKDLQSVTKSVNQKNAEDNMIQSKTSGASLAENPIDRLRRVAKADIIMQLTYTINTMGPKYSVTYNLQGLDAYTNKQIAGAQGTGKQTFTAELPVMLEEAVMNNMDNFCDQLMAYFEDIQENGREVAVDIRVFDNGSGLDLERIGSLCRTRVLGHAGKGDRAGARGRSGGGHRHTGGQTAFRGDSGVGIVEHNVIHSRVMTDGDFRVVRANRRCQRRVGQDGDGERTGVAEVTFGIKINHIINCVWTVI